MYWPEEPEETGHAGDTSATSHDALGFRERNRGSYSVENQGRPQQW